MEDPKNGCYLKYPTAMDDLGVPTFQETTQMFRVFTLKILRIFLIIPISRWPIRYAQVVIAVFFPKQKTGSAVSEENPASVGW